MKKLLATTAIVGLMALPMAAVADTAAKTDTNANSTVTAPAQTTASVPAGGATVQEAGIAPDDLDGKNVYDMNNEEIGEISDVVTNADGQPMAIVDIGGFLGMGAKPVAFSLDQLTVQPMKDAKSADDVQIQVSMSKDELQSLPDASDMSANAGADAAKVDTTASNNVGVSSKPKAEGSTDMAPADQAAATDAAKPADQSSDTASADTTKPADQATASSDMAKPADQSTDTAATADATKPADTSVDTTVATDTTAPADAPVTTTAPADATVQAEAPKVDDQGNAELKDQTVLQAGIDAETLKGAKVYDAEKKKIGEIDRIVAGQDGKTWAIIDVGGFLGFGEKPVALSLDQLTLQTKPEAGASAELDLHVAMSKDEIEALPEYKG